MLRNGHKTRGLTLIELMVTLGVAAILVTVAVPTLQDFVRDHRMTSQSRQLIGLIHLARNEAVQRNTTRMCVRLTNPGANQWRGAVFERGGGSQCSDPPGLDLPRVREITNGSVTIADGTTPIRFDSQGRVHPNFATPIVFSLVHENCRNEERRRFEINRMGRVAVECRRCDGSPCAEAEAE